MLTLKCIGATAMSFRSQNKHLQCNLFQMYKFIINIQQHCCDWSLCQALKGDEENQERKGWSFVVGVIWAIRLQLWWRRQSFVVNWRVRWVRGGGDSPAGRRCAASTAAPHSPLTDACWPWTLFATSAGEWPVHWTAVCRGRQRAVMGCKETHWCYQSPGSWR